MFTKPLIVFLVATIAGLVGCGGDQPLQPTVDRRLVPDGAALRSVESEPQGTLLATIRAATARYHRVEDALADGYVRGSPCAYSPMGAQGEHFRKASLFDAVVDPSQPEMLLYEPQANGDRRLVGVEFIVPSAAWDPGHTGIPMLGDQPFVDRRAPGVVGPPFPNYGLNVWLWNDHPSGMYAEWNPAVTCEFAEGAVFFPLT